MFRGQGSGVLSKKRTFLPSTYTWTKLKRQFSLAKGTRNVEPGTFYSEV